jgi:hypothetical protein
MSSTLLTANGGTSDWRIGRVPKSLAAIASSTVVPAVMSWVATTTCTVCSPELAWSRTWPT